MQQSLLDELQRQLTPETVANISRQLGADQETTEQAISAAVPMMIGGLSYNTHDNPEGAQALDRALERDHDGSLLDRLGGLLGGGSGAAGGGLGGLLGGLLGQGNAQQGEMQQGNMQRRTVNSDGILEHILGPRRSAVEQGVSQASGLDMGKTGQLLALLAPLVMGALGRVKRQGNLSGVQVEEVLDQDRREIESRIPGTQQGGLLSMLDSNKDGKVDMKDDIAKVGMALGGAFLLSKRGRR